MIDDVRRARPLPSSSPLATSLLIQADPEPRLVRRDETLHGAAERRRVTPQTRVGLVNACPAVGPPRARQPNRHA